jgi:hypothetical protein
MNGITLCPQISWVGPPVSSSSDTYTDSIQMSIVDHLPSGKFARAHAAYALRLPFNGWV